MIVKKTRKSIAKPVYKDGHKGHRKQSYWIVVIFQVLLGEDIIILEGTVFELAANSPRLSHYSHYYNILGSIKLLNRKDRGGEYGETPPVADNTEDT